MPTEPAPTPSRSDGGFVGRARELLAAPGGNILVLRAFLGFTFTFAGLQKLANPGFFRANTPGSIQEQLAGAARTTPVHFLVTPALHAPVLFGVLIAIGELAAGLGTLVGFLARYAAGGGMLLSLTFFLTISFHSSPYYYGSDIVFLFAWTPFLLRGAGPLSVDGYLAGRLRDARDQLRQARQSRATATQLAEIDRRAALMRGALAGAGGVLTIVLGGAVAAVGHVLAPTVRTASTTPQLGGGTGTGGTGPGGTGTGGTGTGGTGTGTTVPTTSAGGQPKGNKIGPADKVPVGGAASFEDVATGGPAYVVQPSAGQFLAFSAICTHAGCTVNFDGANETFDCPCHGSIFNAKTGAVMQGPAPSPLPSIPIAEGSDGQLYADG